MTLPGGQYDNELFASFQAVHLLDQPRLNFRNFPEASRFSWPLPVLGH